MEYKITDSQRRATAAFHLRVAKALREVGKIKDVEAAERLAKKVLKPART